MSTKLAQQLRDDPSGAIGMIGYVPMRDPRFSGSDTHPPYIKVKVTRIDVTSGTCTVAVIGTPLHGFGDVNICPNQFYASKAEVDRCLAWQAKRDKARADQGRLGRYGRIAQRRENLADYVLKCGEKARNRVLAELAKYAERKRDEDDEQFIDRVINGRSVPSQKVNAIGQMAIGVERGVPEYVEDAEKAL